MSYIQLPYGFRKNSKQIQLDLPKKYETSQYVMRLPYITNKGRDFDNKIIDLINNREDLKKMVISGKWIWKWNTRRSSCSYWLGWKI